MECDTEQVSSSKNNTLSNEEESLVRPHPNGLLPSGNQILRLSSNDNVKSNQNSSRSDLLGAFSVLDDNLIITILYELKAKDLAVLSSVNKAFYLFCRHEDLWRTLTLENFSGSFCPNYSSWYENYRHTVQPNAYTIKKPIKCDSFYSDLLFQPWFCSTTSLKKNWLSEGNIERCQNLSLDEFVQRFEIPNKPVIITDVVTKWKSFKKWDKQYLSSKFGDRNFSAGHFQLSLNDYFKYSENIIDDQPLYLFDPKFCETAPELIDDFEVPIYFKEDLFALLEDKRPNYRWLIIGPARSGSSFHIDPNSTCAWNGVIKGAKKWIMYPPNEVPPGVHPSRDGANVTSPISLVEWFLDFYEESKETDENSGRVEFILREGELLFVPRGWWHCAINIEETYAITQNYASQHNLSQILQFLKHKTDQISGINCDLIDKSDFYSIFVDKLRDKYPHVIEEVELKIRQKKQRLDLFGNSQNSNFTFGFGN